MPHGSGHTGGFYGGAGFHGGGCHRHNACGYSGSPYYYRRRSCRSPRCGLFWLTALTIGAFLGIVLGVRLGVPAKNSSADEYAPIETRLITFSSTFCESMSLGFSTFPGTLTSGTFQLLSSVPSLTGRDSFQFHATPAFDTDVNYRYWSFYLYRGSKINFSVCKGDSFNFRYYIIEGRNKFKRWENNPSNNRAVKFGTIYDLCSLSRRTNITYDVPTDDEYYMVFYTPTGGYLDTLSIDFDIQRTFYVAQPNQVVKNCTVQYEFDQLCEVNLPMESYFGLLSLGSSGSALSWSDSYVVNVTCTPRAWVYAVIFIACVIVLVAFYVGVVLYCWQKIKNIDKFKELEEEKASTSAPPSVTVPLSTTVAVTPTAPSVNESPAFVSIGEAPPPYGSNAPPKYY